MILNTIVMIFLFSGLIFFTGGGIGILRFPDFYTRLHPAGKLDTLGSLLMMIGISLFNLHEISLNSVLTSIKIILIVVFIFLASPTATHAIMDAGFRAGLQPWEKGLKPKE